MENELITNDQLTPEMLKEIREATGETTMARDGFKQIFFGGKYDSKTSGHYFFKEGKNEDGDDIVEDIGEEIKGIILKVRMKFMPDMKDDDTRSSDIQLFSNEFDNYNEIVELKNFKDKDFSFTGSYKQITGKFNPFDNETKKYEDKVIKCVKVLYIYREGAIYKMEIQGSGAMVFADYIKLFKNDTMLRYTTIFRGKKEEIERSGKTNKFHVPVFIKGETNPDWMKMFQELKKLETPKTSSLTATQAIPQSTQTEEMLPIVEYADDMDEDPFANV